MSDDSTPAHRAPVGRRLPEGRRRHRYLQQSDEELPPAPRLRDFKRHRRLFRQATVYGGTWGEVAILPAKYPLFWVGLLVAVLWFPAVRVLVTDWDGLYPDNPDAQFFTRLGVFGAFAVGLSMMFTRFWAYRYSNMLLADGKQITVRHAAQTSTFAIASVQRIFGGEVVRFDEDGDPQSRRYYTVLHSGPFPGYVSVWQGSDELVGFLKRVRPDINVSGTGAHRPPKDIPSFWFSLFVFVLLLCGTFAFLIATGIVGQQ